MDQKNSQQVSKENTNMKFIVAVTLVATLGGLLFGYDTAVISGGIGFLQTHFELTGAMKGWAASSTLIGCVIGALTAGIISRTLGRKLSMMLAALLFGASAIGTAIPEHFTTFVIFRMLGGAGVGIASMLSPMYIAEIAPAHIRGKLVSFNQLAIVSGILIVYFVNYGIAEDDPTKIPVTVKGEKLEVAEQHPEIITYDEKAQKANLANSEGAHRIKAVLIDENNGLVGKDGQYILKDSKGNFYAVGYMQGPDLKLNSHTIENKGVNDVFIARFNPQGKVDWVKTYKRSGETPFYSLELTEKDKINIEETWNVTLGWRYMFASMAIPALLFFILLFFVPESPRWLVMKGKVQKALDVLKKALGELKAKEVLRDIQESVSAEIGTKEEEVKDKSALTRKVIIIITLVGIMLSIFQQFVGINVVLYYGPEIFRKMGTGTNASLLQTVMVGVVNVLFTFIAIRTVEKVGRKPLLIIGSIGMAIGMTGIGMYAYWQSLGLGTLIFMMIFVASFAMSWGPIVWVLLAEIFPNKIRGIAMSIAVAAQWGANFLVSQTFPMMNNNPVLYEKFHGGFPFWLYALACVVSIFLVWAFVPETKGKSLEEMEKMWTEKK